VNKANDRQVDGTHYKGSAIEHWDWAGDMPYLEGRCTVYIARHKDKGGLKDLAKALHFIQKIAEVRYEANVKWTLTGIQKAEPEEPPREYVNPD
jgi:hypothetical protein